MKFLLPLILGLIGVGAGVGAGIALQPAKEVVEIHPCGDGQAVAENGSPVAEQTQAVNLAAVEFVKLNNQFVIPVVQDEAVSSLVVISLTLEIAAGQKERVFSIEPKLRDAFLQVMFDHANLGGFNGAFTDTLTMDKLRSRLKETAITLLDKTVSDVLIQDISRQDV